MGIKIPRFVVFWTTSTIKDERSAAKLHYIKTVSGKVVAQSNAFQVVSILAGGSSIPLISERKGTDRLICIGTMCVAHAFLFGRWHHHLLAVAL